MFGVRVEGLTQFRVSSFGFRASVLGLRVSGFGFQVRVSGFGFEFRVSGFGLRVRVSGFWFLQSLLIRAICLL